MPKSCYLNFKSCHLNFLIFLFKRSDYKLYFSFFTIITNIGQEKNIKKTLNKLKQKKKKKNIKILKFSMKSLTFSCLICALNLYFAQKFPERQNLLEVTTWNRKKLLKSCRAQSGKAYQQTNLPCVYRTLYGKVLKYFL